jgi:methylase of polypeptide subunit release factors
MPLTDISTDDCRRLREVLDGLQYSEEGIMETMGDSEVPKRTSRNAPRLLYRTSEGTPRETLIRLFMMNVPVDAAAARRALAPLDLDPWIRAGAFEVSGDSIECTVELLPCQDLILASDRGDSVRRGARPDHVLGVTYSALALGHCTSRRRRRNVFDLGTGNGIQAFLAARHSDLVYASDFNPRAVEFAEFNARLNGVSNVRFLTGNLFEPANGLRFDLIVSNPPFMVSPEARYTYRDGGMKGDEFCQTLVRQAPNYLEEGGLCQLMADWVHLDGMEWQERLAGWVEGTGCDVWVFRVETESPPEYAEEWLTYCEPEDAGIGAQLFEQWLAYYEREGIRAISRGVINMRRRSGRNWFQADEAQSKKVGLFGTYVDLRFVLGDFLDRMINDADFIEQKLRLSPDVQLEQECTWGESGWSVGVSRLVLLTGLQYKGEVDRFVLGLLTQCDGRRSLRELLIGLAAAAKVDPARIAGPCLAIIRQLTERGFLLPEGVVPESA